MPGPDPERIAFLKAQPFAHRGLHAPGTPENSMTAFAAAIARGHGIELDVQPTRDNEAVVFHDATLERLTDATGPVAALTARQLGTIPLKGSVDTIPRLDAVLQLVARRVPVLIEVKAPAINVGALCLSVLRALEGYRGDVGVMSFNPQVGHWFALNAPRVTRGLVVSEEGEHGIAARLRGTIKRYAAMRRARPDFLAYDIRDLPSRFAARARARGVPVLTWTVRDATGEARAFAHADEAIYETA